MEGGLTPRDEEDDPAERLVCYLFVWLVVVGWLLLVVIVVAIYLFGWLVVVGRLVVVCCYCCYCCCCSLVGFCWLVGWLVG